MKVLYINKADKEKVLKVKTCCVLSGIQIAAVPEETGLPEDAELMKMSGMNGTQVQQFLAALRKQGVRVDLKCIETEHNRDWTLTELYEELKREHAHMQSLHGQQN